MIPSLLLAAVAAFLAGVLGGFTGFGISVVLVPLPLVVCTILVQRCPVRVVIVSGMAEDKGLRTICCSILGKDRNQGANR